MWQKSIDRRSFVKSCAAGASALLCDTSALNQAFAGEKKSQRPNIILYVTDDHGTDDAGCYGNDAIKTPGLDMLASEGMRFTHSFCTTASCSASRSTTSVCRVIWSVVRSVERTLVVHTEARRTE